MLSVIVDAATLKMLPNAINNLIPLQIDSVDIEPNKYLVMVLHLEGKKVKAKIIPRVNNGMLCLKIDKMFLVGINIDVSGLVSKLAFLINKYLPKSFTMMGDTLHTPFPAKTAGITQDELFVQFI